MNGFMIAAPSSGSGKTLITLGLLRALKERGLKLSSGKAGPDFIDPQFHTIASGEICFNFDPWGMRESHIQSQAARLTRDDQLLVVEAMMGLFDAAADGSGSAADLAALIGLPIILVVDCSKLSHSIAAIVSGFTQFREDTRVKGVILNKVGSARHEQMLRKALLPLEVDVLGAVHRNKELELPERHLGLVQATEHRELEDFIKVSAEVIGNSVDIDKVLALAEGAKLRGSSHSADPLPPFGQRIAVARDLAFSFTYPHLLEGWRELGAEISFFSPLNNNGPAADCDGVFLPGGYPELHAETLSNADKFHAGMDDAILRNAVVYGECGGFMTLGEGIVDANGTGHKMLGALPIETSFAEPKRQLGYRRLKADKSFFWDMPLTAHEFHYTKLTKAEGSAELFEVEDACGNAMGFAGMQHGSVFGSYMHIIDRSD